MENKKFDVTDLANELVRISNDCEGLLLNVKIGHIEYEIWKTEEKDVFQLVKINFDDSSSDSVQTITKDDFINEIILKNLDPK